MVIVCMDFIMNAVFVFILLNVWHCDGEMLLENVDLTTLNNRPIIGVLSQEQSLYLHTKFPEENYTSYIAASYVKDVESAGARVVPILIGKDRSYYEDILSKINGVLFPGGATYFNQSDGYADAGQHIFEIAQKLNDQGDYFPIFGTCLGFELLVILASGRGEEENRVRCYSYSNLPLDFTKDFRSSKMFKEVPEDLVYLLANEGITVNAHQFCIVDENLIKYNLTNDWRVTSYSYDDYGIQFIASFEHTRYLLQMELRGEAFQTYMRRPSKQRCSSAGRLVMSMKYSDNLTLRTSIYPFYGIQFHPEKVAFEWKLSKNYPHSAEAVKANRYFMDFFVSECRKSGHSFANAAEENKYLIYNYLPHFTGVLGSAYHQCYLFEPRGTVSENVIPLFPN